MAEVKAINGQAVIDYMARDFDSLLLSMRNLIPALLPEWKEYESEADFGNVLLQLFAHMGDIMAYYQDRIANESFLGTAGERRAVIEHLRLIGYRLATAAPASAMLELTVSQDFTGTLTVSRGDAFAVKSGKDSPSVRFEYNGEQDLVIDFNTIAPTGGKKIYSRVPVEEGRLVTEEIIGISSGAANQRFLLSHPRLILRSLGMGSRINKDITLVTQLGETIREWTPRESLAFSRKEQYDFAVEIDDKDRGAIIFGDGEFGAVPPPGAVIEATYRVGGGSFGNVGAGAIETIADAPDLSLAGAKVTNPLPATGGSDRESIQHAVLHAPSVFRSLKRAVTAEDYEALALDYKGVGKVRAVDKNWNTVVLYTAPDGGGQVSDVLKKNLLAYFEDKRPISTIVEVEDVDYIEIYVSALVGIESYYSWDDIKEKVQAAAAGLLAFDNVDFGDTLYLSKFYEAVEAIEGVSFVTITEFRRKDIPMEDLVNDLPTSGKITLGKNEIPVIPEEDPLYESGIKVEEGEEE